MQSAARQFAPSILDGDAILEPLERARAQVEDRFRTAGVILAEVLEGVDRLVFLLKEITEALRGDVVESATCDLLSAIERLSALPAQQAERREDLARVSAAAAALGRQVDDMRQTLRYLRVFALNVKISAAGAQEFHDFADEMSQRIEFGVRELDEFDQLLRGLSRQVSDALAAETGLQGECNALLPAITRDLAADADAVRSHQLTVVTAAGDVASLVREVQQKLSRALGALQIGDITRQRIEHVQAGLRMLDELARAGEIAPRQQEALADAVYRLLSAQMADLLDDFRSGASGVAASLAGMADDASRILRLRELTFGGAGEGGMLRALELSVGRAGEIVGGMQKANDDADHIARSASAAAEGLGARIGGVRSVKADVQTMALNTALRCTRMGDAGRPLAVIAGEMRIYANTLDAAADQVAVLLDDLTRDGAAVREHQAGGSADAGAALRSAIDRVRTVGDRAETTLADLGRQSQTVSDTVARTLRHLDFHEDLSAALEVAAGALAARVGPEVTGADCDGPLGELMDRIAKLYTMAREREVHRRCAPQAPQAGSAASDPAPAPAAVGDDEFADVLF